MVPIRHRDDYEENGKKRNENSSRYKAAQTAYKNGHSVRVWKSEANGEVPETCILSNHQQRATPLFGKFMKYYFELLGNKSRSKELSAYVFTLCS